MLNSVLWSKHIVNKIKTLILKLLVQSIMINSAEIWILSRHHVRKLLATEIDFCRRVAKKSRKEKSRNMKIREIANAQQNIIEVVEES